MRWDVLYVLKSNVFVHYLYILLYRPKLLKTTEYSNRPSARTRSRTRIRICTANWMLPSADGLVYSERRKGFSN